MGQLGLLSETSVWEGQGWGEAEEEEEESDILHLDSPTSPWSGWSGSEESWRTASAELGMVSEG